MIIECPHCHTRFRLDPAQLSDSRSMLKCARCHHIFPAPPSSSPPRVRPKPPAPEEQNLSFSFDDDAFDDEPSPGEKDEPMRVGRISLRSVFVFLVLVVCAYGALTWTLLDDPDWAGRLTLNLPVLGKEARERAVSQDVSLIDVQGRYDRTKEGKLVFLITGKAVNHSAELLRGVQITSKLYGSTPQPLDEQLTTCGNPMEAKIADLSIHQVAILRGIKPPADFGVQPGAQCPFVSIFLDVPATVGTFSTEVARAQRQA